MQNQLIKAFEEQVGLQHKKHPSFRPGDTLRVNYKVEDSTKGSDGEKKFRVQVFEGVCLRYKKGTMDATFTVRKIGANSVGVERVFPLHSPFIDSIELITGGRVRRSRLYYLRDLSGKSARIRSRRLDLAALLTSVEEKTEDGQVSADLLPKANKEEKRKARAEAKPKKAAKPKK